MILDVTKDVKWIGNLDPDIRVFDIMMDTKFGTTYNSYFINAEKKTIIDTSKEGFQAEYLEKIKRITDPAEIEYIILNHTEPDHSACLKYLLDFAPNATVVASGNGLKFLPDIIGREFKSIRAKDGGKLDLGNKTLHFIAAPNLHWPDSIFTYLAEDQLLFSCDSFGCHFCDERMFDDEADNFDEAFKYYFDMILKPFSKFMLKAIDKIQDYEIQMICPGHGPILRSNWKKYVHISAEYARQEIENRESNGIQVFIPYVSAYGFTRQMAESIAEGIAETGNIQTEICDIQDKDFHFLNHKIAGSNALVVGSPTFNQNILPQLYHLFASINPIRDRGKAFAAFGSFGWSGEGVGIIENALSTLRLSKILDGLKIKFSPDTSSDDLKEYGRKFGELLMNK